MDVNQAFFDNFEHQIHIKSVDSDFPHGCRLWTGAVNGNYARKRVQYPDGTMKLEYVSRLIYMCVNRVFKVPRLDAHGHKLDMSHLCNNSLCVLPAHLVLEEHDVNMERRHCFNQHVCTGNHRPYCLL